MGREPVGVGDRVQKGDVVTANTKIEWADHTFNPWTGCTKVSPGCDHCYAESWAQRSGIVQWGPHAERRRTSAANWRQPLKWNAAAAAARTRPRVFCASLADVFDNEVPQGWRQDLFELIGETPHMDWLLLTKRIGNAEDMINLALLDDGPTWPWPHVWIGASVVNQEEADRDVPKLLAVPAARRFLSMEPLLGPVDLRALRVGDRLTLDALTGCHCGSAGPGGTIDELLAALPALPGVLPPLDWVIVGGESGHHARPMRVQWARSLMAQCKDAGVAFHIKQLGAQPRGWCAGALLADDDASLDDDFCDNYEAHESSRSCDRCVYLIDRKGGDMAEWPEDLRVREFPRDYVREPQTESIDGG